MKIILCNLVILFITFTDTFRLSSGPPEILPNENDLRRFQPGQIVKIEGQDEYRIVEGGQARELDGVEKRMLEVLKEEHYSTVNWFIRPIKPKEGYHLLHCGYPAGYLHLATADAEGVFHNILAGGGGGIVHPCNLAKMQDTNFNTVAFHLGGKWRPWSLISRTGLDIPGLPPRM